MSILQDKSTRQVAVVAGGFALFGIAVLAFRRNRGTQREVGTPGTLTSVGVTPGCTDLVPYEEGNWLNEINTQITALTEVEIKRAQGAGEVANPAKVAQQLLRMLSPECPVPPPSSYPIYSWYETWTKQSYDLMQVAGLQPGQGLLPDWRSYLAFVEQ